MPELPADRHTTNETRPATIPLTVTRYIPTQHTDTLAALYIESVSKLGAQHYTAREIEIWRSWALNKSTVASTLKEGETLVAHYNDVIAGFAQRLPDDHINMLYTHPSHARQGVATRLLKHLIDNAKHEGAPELTAKASRVSRAVFEQQGFICKGEEWIERRKIKIQRFLMVREL